MKVTVLFLSLLLAASSCVTETKDYDIRYMDLYASTPIGIDCQTFSSGRENLEDLRLNKSQKQFLLSRLRLLKKSNNENIDVRMQGFVMDGKDTLHLCFSTGNMSINNKYFEVDDTLRSFMEIVTDNALAKLVRSRKDARSKQ